MKIKISQIKPNPFRKQISKGKVSKEVVAKIRSNLGELGLMGAIPIFMIGKNYYQVSHHARLQALKEEYGKDYEVEVVIHDYDEEKALRGMAVENLTQRNGDDVYEVVDNLVAIRKFLKSRSDTDRVSEAKGGRGIKVGEVGSTKHIAEWLNQTGEVLSETSIKEHLAIHDKLDSNLYKTIQKTHSGSAERRKDGKTISKSQAILLSSIDDKEEQKDLSKNLLTSRADRVRDQQKLMAKYKKLKTDELSIKRPIAEKDIFISDGWKVIKEDTEEVELRRKKDADEMVRHEAVIQAIRKGEKDIADVGNAIVMPKFPTLAIETKADFIASLDRVLFKEMKERLGELSSENLNLIYVQTALWAKNDLAPFMKELIGEMGKKEERKDEIVFEITDERRGI